MSAHRCQLSPWRILLVEDTQEDAEDISKRVSGWKSNGRSIEVEACTDFQIAKTWLTTRRYDLVILDLIDDKRDGWAIGKSPTPSGGEPELAGQNVLSSVRQNRALPIIFHTAHPERLDFSPSVIGKVVTKGDWAGLSNAIEEIVLTGIPNLLHKIEDVQRSYLWEFIEKHTDQFSSNPMEASILLARRLSFLLRRETLSEAGFKSLETVQPVEYYIYPRSEGDPQAGDIYCLCNDSGETRYFLLLTPSCDMVAGRIRSDMVLLAPCQPLVQRSAFKNWKKFPNQPVHKGGKQTTTEVLAAYLRGRFPQEDRTFFLPPAFDIPALIADFQKCETVEFNLLQKAYTRIATLDSPFAEAASARFARYFGRLGTADLDLDATFTRFEQLLAAQSTAVTPKASQ